eukprot:GFKZ01001160.1.p1 GENE.GFKZ01001160.1~~GFKZ01001160.1.p1  ORF type:complete len:352 (+),score=52.37 GFKZ01001160.1:167-1222(+)
MYTTDLISLVRQDCEDGCITRWKIGFAAILLVEGLLFGHLVYLLRLTGKRFNYIIEFGHALSAGVFLSVGLLHVLPEAVELFEGGHGHGEEEGEHSDEDGDEAERMAMRLDGQVVVRDEEGEEGEEGEEEEGLGALVWTFLVVMITFYGLFLLEQILVPKVLTSRSAKEIADKQSDDVEDGALESGEISEPHELGGFRSRAFATGLIEILGLSAHSLFESMALGLSDEFDTVLNIFIATAAHRWATAAAIAFKLITEVKYLAFLVLLVIFSAMVPLGIGIGAGLSGLSDTVQGVLFAISAGTFIYLGAYESMAEAFAPGKTLIFRKFLATLLGAGIIVVVTVVLKVLDIHG